MAKREILEERTKGRFVISLPKVDIDVREYSNIPKVGGTIATTEASAVSKYIHREIRSPVVARTILANLRDRVAGNQNFSFRLSYEFNDEKGNPLTGSDKKYAEELEICYYLAGKYGGDPKKYLDKARTLLAELKDFLKTKLKFIFH